MLASMRREPTCPACEAPLPTERRWLGLVQRMPKRCPSCGVGLLYDTAGGIYVDAREHEPADGDATSGS